MEFAKSRIERAQQLLYFAFGIVAIVAGADKFLGYIVYWARYLNPAIPALFRMTPQTFLSIVGIIEIIVGILIFMRPIIGGAIVSFWLILISADLLSLKMYDIAIRDVVLAISAYVLVLLSEELHKK